MLRTSDLLGDLKDEYEDVLKEHPTWYVDEVIAFGRKMYHLILRDKISGKVVKWNKTMKGTSLRGDLSRFSSDKLHLYRNPVIDFCCPTVWKQIQISNNGPSLACYVRVET